MDSQPNALRITAIIGNFNDTQNPHLTVQKPFVEPLRMRIYAGSTVIATRNNVFNNQTGSRTYTWSLTEDERNAIRQATVDSQSRILRIHAVYVVSGSELYPAYRDRTVTIIDAAPVFSTFSYEDTNSNTVAITGDDQILVQGKSTLQATIAAADKMTTLKYATPKNYNATITSVSQTQDYSTDDVVFNMGAVSNAGVQRLSIRAYDSRNNNTEAFEDITVIPYAEPVASATIERLNNFEDQTTLRISGSYSRLVIGDSAKNAVNSSSGVKYRYRQTGGDWGSWIDVPVTITNGDISADDIIVSLDNSKQFDFQVSITDLLATTVQDMTVNVGLPVIFIDKDGLISFNSMPDGDKKGLHVPPGDNLWDKIYPVGRIIITTDPDDDPSVLYGGTWVAWGEGRFPVFVDATQSEFDEVEKTGGTKNVTLSTDQIPSHSHSASAVQRGNSGTQAEVWKTYDGTFQRNTTSAGGGQSHNNLPPHITCYAYKRTA